MKAAEVSGEQEGRRHETASGRQQMRPLAVVEVPDAPEQRIRDGKIEQTLQRVSAPLDTRDLLDFDRIAKKLIAALDRPAAEEGTPTST
ncbi:hypothetical protein [Myxococcus eversor]|uniref:hypothetical protein n=1 Tax=Myxococcus eversor TaxID=2709661 RepID=UPI0013D219ED|nr:hypothetical protein [Myxococcus eversor]